MKKLFFSVREFGRIVKNKKNKEILEKNLDVKLTIFGKSITIQSEKNAFNEYLASEMVEALAFGFDIETVLQLKDTDCLFRKIDIKKYAKSSRMNVVKGRIIGTKGKTKAVLEKLSECRIILCDHIVAIIGSIENVEIASQAIITLIMGSPHSKVYASLERNRIRVRELAQESIEEMIKK